jgi:hypothetical protein
MNIDISLLMKEWATLTMEELHQKSLDTPGGVAFTAMRSEGRRAIVVAIATDPDFLERLKVTPDTRNTSWANILIADLVIRFLGTNRATVHVLLDSKNEMSALGLIAATPDSIDKLSRLLSLAN